MDIYQLDNGQPVLCHQAIDQMPDSGYLWIDLRRTQAESWPEWPRRLIGVEVDPEHVEDSLTDGHSSYYDGTPHYDMVIFEGLGAFRDPLHFDTRTVALFIFDRLLISICAEDCVSVHGVSQRLQRFKAKVPVSASLLAHQILDAMVDRYLHAREKLDPRLSELQDQLLSRTSDMEDWRALLEGRRIARRLEALSEDQYEALDAWRRGTVMEWDVSMRVRMRGLIEHVSRVRDHAAGQERDLEAAVQLHFAALSQRANEVMQLFTVAAVVFMPLTLITGIWGMNFKYMPELDWKYAYFVALGLILTIGVGTYIWFKRKNYL